MVLLDQESHNPMQRFAFQQITPLIGQKFAPGAIFSPAIFQ